MDINVTLCQLVDIFLGASYLPDYDPDDGDSDPYGTGIVLDRCEFVRGSTGPIPTAAVFSFCRFTETPPNSGAHAFWNINSRKWLVMSCDWVRTVRGIVCQGYPVKNGVGVACRFWDISQGAANAGEVILMENADGHVDTMSNNAFVWSHVYNCAGSGIQLAGSGMHHNTFMALTLDVRNGAIVIVGYTAVGEGDTNIHHNRFETIEMGANLDITGHTEDNYFNQIVALRNPLRFGSVIPTLPYYGYNDPATDFGRNTYLGFQPFSDTSTHATNHQNRYYNLYQSGPDGLLHVFQFPNVSMSTNPEPPPPPPP